MMLASFGGAAAVRVAPRCVVASSSSSKGPGGPERPIVTKAVAADVASSSPASAPPPPAKKNGKRHSLPAEKLEIVESMDGWLEENVEKAILKSVEASWQPQDFLPSPESPDFLDQVEELRKRTKDIPDAVLVALVGDMVTEEALPTYQTMLNTLDGTRDETGAADTSWARWIRAWTAEENRHGDLLNKYLWCTGRVNMKAVEKTIQYLIGTGMDPKTENNPYMGYIYTSFQERATKISHGHTAKTAKEYGDSQLGKICGLIASDEGRHEVAYQKIVHRLFELDPDYTMLAFEDMMRKQIVMPAHLMYDGENPNIWNDFSSVAEELGVYTAMDYADIIEHLNDRWDIEHVKVVDGEAAKAQAYLMKLPGRVRKLAERANQRKKKVEPEAVKISWIFNREVMRRP